MIRNILLTFLGITIISPLLSAQGTLLNKQELAQKEVYTSLKEALENPENVYRLNLERHPDSTALKTIPAELSQLVNVQELNLSGHRISKIPGALVLMRNLEVLDLSGNPIDKLPNHIQSFKHLKVLKLRLCRLHSIPEPVLNMVQLEQIDLYANKISTIPEELGKFSKLKKLNLGKTGMTQEEIDKAKKLLPRVSIEF